MTSSPPPPPVYVIGTILPHAAPWAKSRTCFPDKNDILHGRDVLDGPEMDAMIAKLPTSPSGIPYVAGHPSGSEENLGPHKVGTIRHVWTDAKDDNMLMLAELDPNAPRGAQAIEELVRDGCAGLSMAMDIRHLNSASLPDPVLGRRIVHVGHLGTSATPRFRTNTQVVFATTDPAKLAAEMQRRLSSARVQSGVFDLSSIRSNNSPSSSPIESVLASVGSTRPPTRLQDAPDQRWSDSMLLRCRGLPSAPRMHNVRHASIVVCNSEDGSVDITIMPAEEAVTTTPPTPPAAVVQEEQQPQAASPAPAPDAASSPIPTPSEEKPVEVSLPSPPTPAEAVPPPPAKPETAVLPPPPPSEISTTSTPSPPIPPAVVSKNDAVSQQLPIPVIAPKIDTPPAPLPRMSSPAPAPPAPSTNAPAPVEAPPAPVAPPAAAPAVPAPAATPSQPAAPAAPAAAPVYTLTSDQLENLLSRYAARRPPAEEREEPRARPAKRNLDAVADADDAMDVTTPLRSETVTAADKKKVAKAPVQKQQQQQQHQAMQVDQGEAAAAGDDDAMDEDAPAATQQQQQNQSQPANPLLLKLATSAMDAQVAAFLAQHPIAKKKPDWIVALQKARDDAVQEVIRTGNDNVEIQVPQFIYRQLLSGKTGNAQGQQQQQQQQAKAPAAGQRPAAGPAAVPKKMTTGNSGPSFMKVTPNPFQVPIMHTVVAHGEGEQPVTTVDEDGNEIDPKAAEAAAFNALTWEEKVKMIDQRTGITQTPMVDDLTKSALRSTIENMISKGMSAQEAGLLARAHVATMFATNYPPPTTQGPQRVRQIDAQDVAMASSYQHPLTRGAPEMVVI